ncbi:MAG: hypothetical protein WAV93_11505 [Bacteroidales bacterium]
MDTLKNLAPTVATAFLGPLGGVAISAVGDLLGITDATKTKIADAIQAGQMTPEQIGKLRELEMQYQNEEKDRGFKYAELAFKDVDSARSMAITTQSITPTLLTWIVVALCLTFEGILMFSATPPGADPIIIGRILGTLDSALIMVLSFWFGSTSGSSRKTEILAIEAAKKS